MVDPLRKAEPLAPNYEQIWLEPVCCVDERSWCEHSVPCEDCDLPSVKYIRADIAEAEIERLCAALEPFAKAWRAYGDKPSDGTTLNDNRGAAYLEGALIKFGDLRRAHEAAAMHIHKGTEL